MHTKDALEFLALKWLESQFEQGEDVPDHRWMIRPDESRREESESSQVMGRWRKFVDQVKEEEQVNFRLV